jgi:PmbA protein
MTIRQIRTLIEAIPGISSWEIHQIRKKTFQRYFIFDQIESQRIVEKVNYLVSIYQIGVSKGEQILHESSLMLSQGDDFKERLSSAMEMASLVANPLFYLPERGLSYYPVETADPVIKNNPTACLDQIQDDLVNSPSMKKIKRSSAEIFIEDKEVFFTNSNGIELENSETEILVEFTLLAGTGSCREGESQGIRKNRFYCNLQLKEILEEYAQFARDSIHARLPEAGIYPVVFSEEPLDNLFNYFCLQTSGSAQYQQLNQLILGKPVISNHRGDSLTLVSNPLFPGGMKSRSFDDNGSPLSRIEVIKNNVFQKRMNSKRYADYLKEEATGNFTNIEVLTGSESIKDLLKGPPCYHLLRFSTFDPNPVTGAFSGEIRTGYFIKEGQIIPIKGGSVSGMIQEAFQDVFFSQEKTLRESYWGPKAVRFERLAIAGN